MKSRSYQSKQADYDNLCEKEQLMRGAVDGWMHDGREPEGCLQETHSCWMYRFILTFKSTDVFSQFLYSSEVLIMKILLCNIGLLFQTLLLSISRILVM